MGVRFLRACDLELDARPEQADANDDGSLRIVWASDAHVSCYRADWLRRHCYSEESRRRRRFDPTLWKFSEAINHTDNVLRVRLEHGDCVVFDNHRVFHGREAFSGERRLLLTSVNRQDFHSTLR